MNTLDDEKLIDILVKGIKLAVTTLPNDVKKAIENAHDSETNPTAKKILESIIENYQLAEKQGIPMCQDTGILTWYIDIGKDSPLVSRLKHIIYEASRKATSKVPIRPNAVNPFTGENSGDNTGRYIPWIEWNIKEGDDLIITILPKGGGSEFTSQFRMLSPGLGIKGLKKTVAEVIFEAGGKPCPPIIVGVGIGGGADIALKLGKKAILRPIDQRHGDREVAKLEKELHQILNKLGIGPMGLGGDTTVLGVNVEYAYRHPANLPIGVVTQCWAARKATIQISPNGEAEITSHNIKLSEIKI